MRHNPTARQIIGNRLRNVKKIAVLRANSLGDYMFTLPALEALRAAYPRAQIVLLGKPWHREFLSGRPGPVDRILALPRITGVCDIPGEENEALTSSFIEAARRERFDICAQLYGGGRFSNPFVSGLRARLTIGMKAPDAASTRLDRWVPYIYYFPEVLRYLEVVRLAGAEAVTLVPRLAVTARDTAEAGKVFPALDKPFALLHPGASDTRRRWPAEKFAQTGAALMEKGWRVCITGSGDEEPLCSQIADALGNKAINLYGRLSLAGMTGLLSRARVVIANDTGPLHLARAAGAPTVAIYWVGNYINAAPPDMLRHRSHISWRLECPACGTNCIENTCPHRPSFVADIPAEPVIASALELLSLPSRQR